MSYFKLPSSSMPDAVIFAIVPSSTMYLHTAKCLKAGPISPVPSGSKWRYSVAQLVGPFFLRYCKTAWRSFLRFAHSLSSWRMEVWLDIILHRLLRVKHRLPKERKLMWPNGAVGTPAQMTYPRPPAPRISLANHPGCKSERHDGQYGQ
jgi:hypothetical protein